MEITVKAVGDVVTSTSKSGKKYSVYELLYKVDGADKSESRKITQYAGAYKALLGASPGEVFTIDAVKDDAGYWQWNSATSKGTAAPSAVASEQPTGASVTKAAQGRNGGWETPEERAARQVMIVRQSCLGYAISFAGLDREKAQGVQTDDIIAWATEFASYVFGEESEGDTVYSLKEDLDKRVD